jgi:cobalt-zinc-cadmium efflux system protein
MNAHDHQNHTIDNNGSSRALWWALGINATFLVVEFIGGLLTNSLALLADAGHMLTDVAALGIALIAHHIAQWSSTKRRTYGYGRVKVLAALLNGLSLWLIVGVIAWEAIHRLADPPDIKSLEMLLIATAGLIANLASAWMLKAHQKDDINIRGAFLHLMADSLGSLAVIIAGLLMLWGGWFIIDPILSVAISLLILWSSISIVKDAVRILLESAPRGIKLDAVKAELESFDEVLFCHDLHIWSIGSDQPVLTAHLVVSGNVPHNELLARATSAIQQKFGITHATLQLEPQGLNPDLSCDPP